MEMKVAIMATMVFIRTIVKHCIPPAFYNFLKQSLRKVPWMVSCYVTVVIEKNDGMRVSEVYEAVQTYLNARAPSASTAKRLKLHKLKNSKDFTFSLCSNEQIVDEFEGMKVWWVFRSRSLKRNIINSAASDEKRCYELKFHKKHKDQMFNVYLPHVMAEAKTLDLKRQQRKIYMNKSGDSGRHEYSSWTRVVFDHPATFDTLALEPELKQEIVEDLERFSKGEKYYRQVGRAWKRGYLLYGPPGTGKSSMIAAMANFLDYDIYDLELTQVKNNAQLRKLLIATTNKSIIVIEDIDCSLDLSDRKEKNKQQQQPPSEPSDREKKKLSPSEPGNPDESKSKQDSAVTLSGVLNFTDGLWSCCGSERLFVFTTNHIERLDPALLRSGRMDKHILLSFCTFSAFTTLARNYLGIDNHELFPEIQGLMEVPQMTPADVTEHLMEMRDHPTSALQKLIQALLDAKETEPTPAFNGLSQENATKDQV